MRRCGYCLGSGHNKRTCPSLKVNNTETVKTVSASNRRAASCSFCRARFYKVDRTHTRSTCVERKRARADWIEENSSWAFKFKMDMVKFGIGIGSLVEYGEGQVFEIVKIAFDELTKDTPYGYAGRNIAQEENSYYRRLNWIPYPTNENSTWSCKIVAPISPERVAAQFPSDWEYGAYGVPRSYEDTKRNKRKKTDR